MYEIKREYYENGNIEHEEYYLNGKKHRIERPASIYYYENGNTRDEFYYLDGKLYSEEEYNKIMKEIKELSEGLRLIDPRRWVREYV